MKYFFLVVILAMAGCSSEPPPLNKPSSDAIVWDLNVGRWPGTNKLIQEPPQEALATKPAHEAYAAGSP